MPSADELVQSCTPIFTLPDMYFRVRDVVDDPKATTDDLVNAIKFDPAMSARLLRIVNSSLYGFAKQIDTLTRAVTLLGMQAVNDLVMALTGARTFSGMTMQLMDMPMFWRKSVLCALLAGRIAKSCGIDDSERFFIEGLLRDIGHLVMYQTVPQRAQSALVEAGYLGRLPKRSVGTASPMPPSMAAGPRWCIPRTRCSSGTQAPANAPTQ